MSRVACARHVACPYHANALSTPYGSQASLTIMQSVTQRSMRTHERVCSGRPIAYASWLGVAPWMPE
jgi:hypothetical protein